MDRDDIRHRCDFDTQDKSPPSTRNTIDRVPSFDYSQSLHEKLDEVNHRRISKRRKPFLLARSSSAPPESFFLHYQTSSSQGVSPSLAPPLEEDEEELVRSEHAVSRETRKLDSECVETPENETKPLLADTRAAIGRDANGDYKYDMELAQQDIFMQETRSLEEDRRLSRIALTYLMDHEASRAPTLPPDSDYVTDRHLMLHAVRFSSIWKIVMTAAMIILFSASCLEGISDSDGWGDDIQSHSRQNDRILLVLTFVPALIFTVDLFMLKFLLGQKAKNLSNMAGKMSPTLNFRGSTSSGVNGDGTSCIQAYLSTTPAAAPVKARRSRSRWWALPLTVFLIALSIETILAVQTHHIAPQRSIIWASAFKPIVLFYGSHKARNALDALNRVARVALKAILVEVFLISTFGALACQLYGDDFLAFKTLPTSFVSMFQVFTGSSALDTWMPVYDKWHSAVFFFVSFLVICVFYLQPLVLSLVFQSYMEGLVIIHDHASSDREETLRLTFQTLYRMRNGRKDTDGSVDGVVLVSTKSAREVLMMAKPWYSREKINALESILDPTHAGFIDYNSFRNRMPKAMQTSVRTSKHNKNLSELLVATSAVLAIINLVYVIMASSSYNPPWLQIAVVPLGGIITLLATADLCVRLSPKQKHRLTDAIKPNATFDGLAVIAAAVSLASLVFHHILKYHNFLDFLITGRAIDMMRCLRLAKEARGIVKRSGEVLPHVSGPVVLLVTTLHVFTYLGMALWGGAIQVGQNLSIPAFYDLNNFNEYSSGLMTMFQGLVATDWHTFVQMLISATAEERSNHWVNIFFISANLINVSILLNVLVAFFVGAFITRVSRRKASQHQHSRNKADEGLKNVGSVVPLSRGNNESLKFGQGVATGCELLKLNGESDEDCEENLTVSERQGFDAIVRTVAGEEENDDDKVKECCRLLALFETLNYSGDNQVGYLVTCHQSMSRYGNPAFHEILEQYMNDAAMHTVISDMHTELVKSSHGHKISVKRTFPTLKGQNQNKMLSVTASLLKEGSSISLFVAKRV